MYIHKMKKKNGEKLIKKFFISVYFVCDMFQYFII